MYSNQFLELWTEHSSVAGPYSIDQCRGAVQAGQLSPNAYARLSGTQQWYPLGQLLAYFAQQQQAYAPPPAAPPPPPPPPQPAQGVPGAAPMARPPPPLPPRREPEISPEQVAKLKAQAAEAERQAADAEQRLSTLRRELESVEEAIEIQSFGFYRPRYGLESSDAYVQRLREIREKQKQMIKDEEATFAETKWSIDGSVAEGRKMMRRQAKLMLRAFNGECDAAIAKARYDNVVTLEQRIHKSCHDINKLSDVNRIFINQAYYELKVAELHLVHEHREKVQQEKEEQKRIREQMREEIRAQEEIEKAQAAAEEEEAKYQKALSKARQELEAAQAATATASAKQTEKLESLVNRLETQLQEALDRKAKAIARAQLTRSGHVYVLSNIGSFGEGIYKIGLTRRFEPLERVDELGDASVPFPFDVHAIIYSEDAPTLEATLHREFADHRVNMVNGRKEYFRVSLDEIRTAVEKHFGLVSFVLTPEAEEWRKTRALLEARQPATSK